MLRIEDIEIDGDVFRVREPRLSDFMKARDLPGDQFVFSMLGGMLLKPDSDEPLGEAVMDLPMRVVGPLAEVVNRMVAPTVAPLAQRLNSYIDSPLPSEDAPSVN